MAARGRGGAGGGSAVGAGGKRRAIWSALVLSTFPIAEQRLGDRQDQRAIVEIGNGRVALDLLATRAGGIRDRRRHERQNRTTESHCQLRRCERSPILNTDANSLPRTITQFSAPRWCGRRPGPPRRKKVDSSPTVIPPVRSGRGRHSRPGCAPVYPVAGLQPD